MCCWLSFVSASLSNWCYCPLKRTRPWQITSSKFLFHLFNCPCVCPLKTIHILSFLCLLLVYMSVCTSMCQSVCHWPSCVSVWLSCWCYSPSKQKKLWPITSSKSWLFHLNCPSATVCPLSVHISNCNLLYYCLSVSPSVHLCVNLPLTFLCLYVAFLLMLLSFERTKLWRITWSKYVLCPFKLSICLFFKDYPHIVHTCVYLLIYVSVCLWPSCVSLWLSCWCYCPLKRTK